MMRIRYGGAFMDNYNPIWGVEVGFSHTGPLNCASYNSPYGYSLRLGLYFDRYFNILDGTTFKSPLYNRYLIPLSYNGYLSLQGILEYYGLIGKRRKELYKSPWIDLRMGVGPSAYYQIVKPLEENMRKEDLIPSEHPVLRGVDRSLFLGLNANAELHIILSKYITLSLQSQMDIFIYPVPLGKFPAQDLVPELPKIRTKGAMSLNRTFLPSFMLFLNLRFLHNERKRVYKSKQHLFKKKKRSPDKKYKIIDYY